MTVRKHPKPDEKAVKDRIATATTEAIANEEIDNRSHKKNGAEWLHFLIPVFEQALYLIRHRHADGVETAIDVMYFACDGAGQIG
jgi:hypothetical protein